MATQYFARSRDPSAVAARAEVLIQRYPNLSEVELAELINLMPRLPVLDFGLMTADPVMSSRLDDFYREHGRKVRTSVAPLVIFLLLPLAVVAATAWSLIS